MPSVFMIDRDPYFSFFTKRPKSHNANMATFVVLQHPNSNNLTNDLLILNPFIINKRLVKQMMQLNS